jgi:adenylate cyclase
MDDNEEATVRTLTSYRSAITDLVQQYRGRVVDSPGDNVLAEFASVVDSVNCAVEIQRDLAERNAELPDNRKMQFRIGVNLGDVIDEEGRIYGDGVNIAARVESLAEAGGICISGRAHTQVENKLGLEYEDLGKHEVKNISRPIQVYRVLSFPGAAAHRVVQAKKTLGRKWRKIVFSVAVVVVIAVGLQIWQLYGRRPTVEPAGVEKSSIVVLPFDNLSVGDEQEYFADGMTDELITNLSKISGLLVISRNSAFTYKGKPVKIQQVAKELDVRYVLEGSVQRDRDRVRIRAQLIDGVTDHHLWAESYDGVMEDIFGLQDEITRKIASALAVELTREDQERFGIEETENIEAYDALLKGQDQLSQATWDGYKKAISYYKLAIELDPNYSRAHAKLAYAYLFGRGIESVVPDPHRWKDRLRARKHLEIAMSKPTSTAHIVASEMAMFQYRFDEAASNAERAMALNPNDPDAYTMMASLSIFTGRPQQALEFVKKSMRLDPHNISDDLYTMVMAHICMGEYEKAAPIVESAIGQYPDIPFYWVQLAICYAHLGRIKEAKSAWKKGIRGWYTEPNLEEYMVYLPFKSAEYAEIFADGLLKAGCAGRPSGYYKIYEENRLSGKEVEELRSGHKTVFFWQRSPFWAEWSRDGKWSSEVLGEILTGTWWIKDDRFCYSYETPHDIKGLFQCEDNYRNPDSTPGSQNEYLDITEINIYPWSVEK